MILFILILGSVLTAALVSVDAYTAPFIEKNRIIKLQKSILTALDISYTKGDLENVFAENIEKKTVREKEFYVSGNGNTAFEIQGSGLWGPISAIIALLPDLKTIYGITIIHQEETAGLGSRIGEKDFLDRFKNKKLFPELMIVRPPAKASGENEVDGITGATFSCKAFEKIVNSESKKYISIIEGR